MPSSVQNWSNSWLPDGAHAREAKSLSVNSFPLAISTNSALRAFSAFIRSTGSNDRCATGSEVRWNRRRYTRGAFDTLLGIGVGLAPATYRDFIDQRV
jgi:hypothetical protein